MEIAPADGSINPAIIISTVVFPDPLGPSKVTNSPAAIWRLTPSTARTLSYALASPSSRTRPSFRWGERSTMVNRAWPSKMPACVVGRALEPSYRSFGSRRRYPCWSIALDRFLALVGDSAQDAACVGVECAPTVDETTIVPYDHVADAPAVLPNELGLRHVLPDLLEKLVAFLDRETVNVAIAAAAKEKRLALGFGVRAHDGMDGARTLGLVGHRLEAAAHVSRRIVRDIVDRPPACHLLLQRRRQALIGGIHVRESSVPTAGWYLDAIEKRC